MRKLGLHEIRKEYLEFFEEKSHLIIPSFSLVPKDDDSLLLIGAGMAPLKKFFTGEETPTNKRVTSCQKCIRTGDIENVGITSRHATFFEMLGNFSFGDYFKEESIEWAWEFLTKNLEIDEEKLWVTVYLDDDEAEKIWNEKIGLPKERIIRLGKEDNFWELEVGPSGPCSEIYFDKGKEYGCQKNSCQPGCDCDRFVELWNLVFTQFDKDIEGNYNDLPNPNIDTGMGLERIAAVLEGVDSIFDVEAIRDILSVVENISGTTYGENEENDISLRIITDHSRAMAFLVSDGVIPSNEGRGYVLRRLIRRASRHGKLLGVDESFLGTVVDSVINSWMVEYNELDEKREHIKKIIKTEEERFQETIDQGLDILEKYIKNMKEKDLNLLDGESAFKLYDTYGFPLDLTVEILKERDLNVDLKSFNKHMEKQRARARAARNNKNIGWMAEEDSSIYGNYKTEFKGYEHDKSLANILGLYKEGEEVNYLSKGDKGTIILNKTPFYPEGGGQIGDTGFIYSAEGTAEVLDTQSTDEEHLLHVVKITEGKIKNKSKVEALINSNKREFIKRNHTSTHLLHQALKDVLGEQVNQAGSIVEDSRLRFDFTHHEGLNFEQLSKVEQIVNDKIFNSLSVNTQIMSLDDAKKQGVIGLFDEKYEDDVRVLSIGDYSKELCGGTHVDNTNEIGIFKILSETSVAAGVRRIEAISSKAVYDYLNKIDNDINQIAKKLKSNRSNIKDRVDNMIKDLSDQSRELESLRMKMASSATEDILDSMVKVGDTNLITYKLNNMDMNGLRTIADELKEKAESALIVLAGIKDDKLYFVVTATNDLVEKGIHSGHIIKEVAEVTGGSGGGRPDMAQAGGKDINKVDNALRLAHSLLKDNLEE